MGKIRVPAYKNEPEILVQGKHEALISSEIFYRVQDILDGRRRTQPKLERRINPDLFLRKFLKCSKCSRSITGATSKGNGGHYTYYYSCESSQHLLIRADRANESFIRVVSTLRPNSHVLKLYQSVLTDIHVDMRKEIGAEISALREQLQEKNRQIEHVEDLLVSCGGHMSRYSKILARYEKEAHELQMRIEIMETGNRTEIKPKLDYVISRIDNVVLHMSDAPVEVKIKLIGSIFDEKIEFDGKHYRTGHVNRLVDVRSQQNNELKDMSEQKRPRISHQSTWVPRTETLGLGGIWSNLLIFKDRVILIL